MPYTYNIGTGLAPHDSPHQPSPVTATQSHSPTAPLNLISINYDNV